MVARGEAVGGSEAESLESAQRGTAKGAAAGADLVDSGKDSSV